MHTNYQWLSIGFVLLVFIFPVDALGASSNTIIDTSIGWKISTFFDDIRVNYFISDPVEKSEAIAVQASKAQLAIEILSSEGKPVPNDLVKRVTEKRELAKEIIVTENITDEEIMNCLLPPCSQTTKQILDSLEDVDEANKLRLLVNDFSQLRADVQSGNIDPTQIEIEANRIDSEVNNLEIVDKHCNTRIHTLDLTSVDSPYKSLQDNCPILQNHSLEDAQKQLRLLGSDID